MTSEHQKRRLHPVGALVMTSKHTSSIAFLAVLAALGRGGPGGLGWVYAALIPLLVGHGLIRWFRFRYWLEDRQFRVQDGALIRKNVYIPLDKIQAVDVTAGVVQRVFGIVKLEIKTGAAGTQAELGAISRAEADRIRLELRPDADSLDVASESLDETGVKVYRLSPRQLLLAGATSGQLGVVFGVIGWIWSQIDEVIIESLGEIITSLATVEEVPTASPVVIVALVVVGLLLSWGCSVVWEVVRYGRFAAYRNGDDIVVRRGLLEQRHISLPVHRIQAVRYYETVLRQPIQYGTMYIEAVGHAEKKGVSSILHPFIQRDEALQLIRDLLPQFDVQIEYIRPPRRAIPRFFIFPTVVTAASIAPFVWLEPWVALGFGVLPLVWLVGYLSWRDTGLCLTDEVAVVRSRRVRRTTTFLLRQTAQTVQTTMSILQRSRDVATVHVTVATGAIGRTFAARDLDRGDAWRSLRWVTAASDDARAEPDGHDEGGRPVDVG